MASKYWIKLYHEILDDPKMGRLRDRLWRRVIECFLLAGELEEDGWLPPLADMAWRLRADAEQLETELAELAAVGILEMREGRWFVSKFAERQAALSGAERMARLRERKRKQEYYAGETPELPDSDDGVTFRHTDTDTEKKRKDTDSAPAPLVRAFCDYLKIPAPDLRDRWAMHNWLEPESAILSIAGGDEEKGADLVRATLAYMDEHGLSYKNLKSLVATARTVWNMRQKSNGAGSDHAWAIVEEALSKGDGRLLIEHPAVLAAVDATGGWVQYKESSTRDRPFLKKAFIGAYHG